MEEKRIADKTIVVTGASSGAGRAMAGAFAKHSAKLVLAARDAEALEELANECRSLGALVKVVPTDVTEEEDMVSLAAEAKSFGGDIDVWVNNAGVLAMGPFDEIPVEIHDQVIRTNLLGYLHGAHAVMPYFKEQHHGILINNISIGAFLPVPYGVGYSASKFGLRGFSAALKAELSDWKDIHICDLFPAFLDTPGIQHAANYTGKVIQPIPPVHDPVGLAEAVVKLVQSPQSSSHVHLSSFGLRILYALFPDITRSLSKKMIRAYLKHSDGTAETSGNLYAPLAFRKMISGGWNDLFRKKLQSVFIGGLVLGLGVTILWTKKR